MRSRRRAALLAGGVAALFLLSGGALAQSPPPNDDFANAEVLSGLEGSATGTNTGATVEEGEPSHAAGTTSSVWYVWTAPAEAGEVTIETIGSSFDTILAVYTGEPVDALSYIVSDDDSGGGRTSRVTFPATPDTAYRIAVGGYGDAAGDVALHWRYSAGGSISGTVVDSWGRSLSGVCVTAHPGRAWWSAGEARTAEDGTYRISGLTNGEYSVDFNCAPGRHGEWFDDRPHRDLAELLVVREGETVFANATMDLPSSIAGTVRDGAGNPVPGICVAAYGDHSNSSGMSGETGEYVLEWLRAGEFQVYVHDCTASRYLTAWQESPVVLEHEQVLTGYDPLVTLGGRIEGYVTDRGGLPVAGICVYVLDHTWSRVGAPFQLRTGVDGSFAVYGLPTGAYRVRFEDCDNGRYIAEWYDNRETFAEASPVEVHAEQVTSGISAVLSLGGRISGTITDRLGPLANACVSPSGPGSSSARTDELGRYTVRGLLAGSYKVYFDGCEGRHVGEWHRDKPDQEMADVVEVAEEQETSGVDAVLALRGGIAGRVTDLRGVPIVGVCVDSYPNSWWYAEGRAVTDVAGDYAIDWLPSGPHYVSFGTCRSDEHLSEWHLDSAERSGAETVTVHEGAHTTVNAQLARSSTISGTVTDRTGMALDGICVAAGGSGAYTREDGTYTIRGLRPGTYAVSFQDCAGRGLLGQWYDGALEDSAATTLDVGLEQDVAGIDATMRVGGRVSGTVTNGSGTPIRNVCVELYRGYSRMDSMHSDVSGAYSFSGLSGSYDIYFRDCADGKYVEQWFEGAATQEDATHITVGAEEEMTADVVMRRAGTITGTVENSAGDPATGVCITATRPDGFQQSAGTDAKGDYAVGRLLTGSYTVHFSDCGGGFVEEWYDDAPDGGSAASVEVALEQVRTGIDAVLTRRAAASGRVTARGSGTPLRGICVHLTDENGNQLATSHTTITGRYVVSNGNAGTYRLRFEDCASTGYLPATLPDPVTLDYESETTGVDASLTLGGSIGGTIRSRAGRSLYGICAKAFASSDADDEIARASSGRDGSYALVGLTGGSYKVSFEDCRTPARYLPEWNNDKTSFESADGVSVTVERRTIVDARLEGTLQYFALGDSIAAGVPDASGGCAQAPGAYPALLTEMLRSEFSVSSAMSLACAGAAAAPEGPSGPGDLAAQVDRVLSERNGSPGLATISVGWDDLGLQIPDDQRYRLCDQDGDDFTTHFVGVRVPQIRDGVESAVRRLLDAGGEMSVVVTELYQPFNAQPAYLDDPYVVGSAADRGTCDRGGEDPGRARRRAELVISSLNDALTDIVTRLPLEQQPRYRTAALERAFDGREAALDATGFCGSTEPLAAQTWVQVPVGGKFNRRPGDCWMPNAEGASAIARAVFASLPNGAPAADVDPPGVSWRTKDGAILLSAAGGVIEGVATDRGTGVHRFEVTYSPLIGAPSKVTLDEAALTCTDNRHTCAFRAPFPLPGVYTVAVRVWDGNDNYVDSQEIRLVVLV